MTDNPKKDDSARATAAVGNFAVAHAGFAGVSTTAAVAEIVVVHTVKEAIAAIRDTRPEFAVSSETWPLWFWRIVIPAILLSYMLLNCVSLRISREGAYQGDTTSNIAKGWISAKVFISAIVSNLHSRRWTTQDVPDELFVPHHRRRISGHISGLHGKSESAVFGGGGLSGTCGRLCDG
jgi:hypothetical protein